MTYNGEERTKNIDFAMYYLKAGIRNHFFKKTTFWGPWPATYILGAKRCTLNFQGTWQDLAQFITRILYTIGKRVSWCNHRYKNMGIPCKRGNKWNKWREIHVNDGFCRILYCSRKLFLNRLWRQSGYLSGGHVTLLPIFSCGPQKMTPRGPHWPPHFQEKLRVIKDQNSTNV